MSIIDSAIEIHGAKKVYDAAYKRMQGDAKSLQDIGLTANTLREANEIMTAAYNRMTKEQQVADYWDASQELNKIKS